MPRQLYGAGVAVFGRQPGLPPQRAEVAHRRSYSVGFRSSAAERSQHLLPIAQERGSAQVASLPVETERAQCVVRERLRITFALFGQGDDPLRDDLIDH
jgi:hypothetical protein